MRSSFGSSRLVRLLGEGVPVAEAPGMDFAERLSLWLNAFDAIGLQSAHQAIRSLDAAAGTVAVRASRSGDLADDLQRVRSVLAKAIAQDPLAMAATAPGDEPAYLPYQQRHLELQRQMEQMVGALRDHARQAVCRASPRLRRLAALDAALEQVLARREQETLPAAIALLKRRFEQLRSAGTTDAFAGEWRQALLAELELRLEPVTGLIEALRNEARAC
ncbi:DUF3348 domain-containing protein [Ramlibacter solisilvae]|uniref:DUF3348 domain-containing protein n=1 Tax=Ramlibacter tataouinensis TaxID=94132 RepID=A0A127JRC7_9BURK|nr:DUF3348 family protein [Ramlibacter tataouinensis]AMO22465.1 hypothetical protein UC35_05590 [Ramlibacter tataouinensis]